LRVKREESRLAWALVGCALYGCRDKIVEEHGDLLDALGELKSSFPDKPAEWFYRATYRLLAGKVERVGAEHWLVKGLPELGNTYPWYNVWGKRGEVQARLLLPRVRLREGGEDMHAHRHGYAVPEAAPVARRISLNAASPHASSSGLQPSSTSRPQARSAR